MIKTLDGTVIKETAYAKAVKAWARDGKKYPLETYMVTVCSCGCTKR
jgi:hypothetical protein